MKNKLHIILNFAFSGEFLSNFCIKLGKVNTSVLLLLQHGKQ